MHKYKKEHFIPAGWPQTSSGWSGETLRSGPHTGNDTQTQALSIAHALAHKCTTKVCSNISCRDVISACPFWKNIQTATTLHFGHIRSTAASRAHLEPHSSLIPQPHTCTHTHTYTNMLWCNNSCNPINRQIQTHHKGLYAPNTFAACLKFDIAGEVKLI